jgi:2-(1,2-epoxy-1,2-dihydrophenyl)acetyl-CoA isomerase
MDQSENLKIEMKDQTQWITINRPKVYNALTRDAKLEMIKAIRMADRNKEVRSIVITGEGNAFCTGQDLNDRTVQGEDAPVDLGVTLETEWNPLVNAIRNAKKPVIAVINGVCAGAGLSVALACDFLISVKNVKFVSGFSKLGLAPDAGSSFTLTHALGKQKALDFFLFNNPLMSEELHTAGIIKTICEDQEQLTEECTNICQELNKMAPLSIELIKKNCQYALDSNFKESMSRETASQRFLGNSEDYREGLKAFFEKRGAEFIGK